MESINQYVRGGIMNRTVLAIFKNDNIKSFHIWTTTQEDLKNVTVTNAYSKAKSSINGKLSSESAATTSFFRVLLNTDRKDWYVRYINIGVVNSKDGEDFYNLYADELIDMNYKCLTRNKKYRHASGKYAGKKHQYMMIEDMIKKQIERHATNMLEDISYSNDMAEAVRKIYNVAVNKKNTHINNISELWKHIYENYSEAA